LAALLIATIAAIAAWMLRPVSARPILRAVIVLGPDEVLTNLNTPALAISPDGINLVYVARRRGGPAQLFLRPLDALTAKPVAGTEGAVSPFFSPDGKWIAYFAGSQLKKVAVAGGTAITLCDAGSGIAAPGGTWGPKNTIVFQATTGAFFEVPDGGGTPRRVASSSKRQFWRWPEFTPGGSRWNVWLLL
jgi:Tol biopolymer transport system component